jgi:hypothetical protein
MRAKHPDPALQRAPIYLDERLSEGFIVVCSGGSGEHSFVLRGLGPSIECPLCGRTALSSQLVDAYYERLGRIAANGATLGRHLKSWQRSQQSGLSRSLR